jgi:hypothetical protein
MLTLAFSSSKEQVNYLAGWKVWPATWELAGLASKGFIL